MKKTLITLLALSGIASAAIELTAVTNWGGSHLSEKNTYGYLPQLWDQSGATRTATTDNNNPGVAYAANTLSKIQTVGNTDFNLKFASATDFTIIEDLHFNQILSQNETDALSLNFSTAGSLNAKGSVDFGNSRTSYTLSATLTDAELAKLDARQDVTRTLITTNFIESINIKDLATKLKLGSIAGSSATYGGVIYSLTTKDGITYYNISDVAVPTTGENKHRYVDVSNAEAIDLAANTSYIVIGGKDSTSGAAMKTVSYMVTAVPEPTTATLSLLALAGLAARRRRR